MRAPPTFHGFCGQTKIVASLKRHISGALRQNLPLPHITFKGESGMGKTALSRAIAKAMETTCHEVYCGPEIKRWQLAERLSRVQKCDLVFCDEIHALKDNVQEILYPAIDRHQVPLVEDGKMVDGEWLDIPEFTLIAATDQPGKLKNALRQRMVLSFDLGRYLESEMREIVSNRAAEIGILLSTHAVTRLAGAARGIPRHAGHLLQSLKTCAGDTGADITKGHVTKHLDSLGVDSDNLKPQDRLYLSILAENPGTHVSQETLALRMGLDKQSVRRDVEAYLTQRGWVLIEPRGRRLSDAGSAYVQKRGWT